MFMREAPSAEAVRSLQGSIKGREIVKAVDNHAYITYPDGIGTSKLTIKQIESGLGSTGTGRNWNTVLKLAALSGPST
jgi:uncharacterized protein (DUF1697 family)